MRKWSRGKTMNTRMCRGACGHTTTELYEVLRRVNSFVKGHNSFRQWTTFVFGEMDITVNCMVLVEMQGTRRPAMKRLAVASFDKVSSPWIVLHYFEVDIQMSETQRIIAPSCDQTFCVCRGINTSNELYELLALASTLPQTC
jgi:hypothetical protein